MICKSSEDELQFYDYSQARQAYETNSTTQTQKTFRFPSYKNDRFRLIGLKRSFILGNA